MRGPLRRPLGLIPAHAGKTRRRDRRRPAPRAHPRSRGENRPGGCSSPRPAGSSPLTRGKPGARRRAGGDHGLIPAHAGKTALPGGRPCGRRAHPRSRGENPLTAAASAAADGSSPLTRGKRSGWARRGGSDGLIPAHAGKTLRPWWRLGSLGAHPRSRGENDQRRPSHTRTAGSSPLTRGKRLRRRLQQERDGLIPAHAGKTRSTCVVSRGRAAHPRSRGENFEVASNRVSCLGSSPLTRGKPHRLGFRHPRARLIPAHAGKTTSGDHPTREPRAHPRSRGENRFRIERRHEARGSSPLTRGKLEYQDDLKVSLGLIPAHAGKTVSSGPLEPRPGAHPRSRGENN